MERILIVEDESRIREMIREYIENEGFEALEAEDGEEAIEKYNQYEPSLIILDVMLPKIDGWSVCREIRRKSEVPIIMLTARGEEYDRIFGFELGVDDYVTKPFSPRELLARIKVILKRGKSTDVAGIKSEIFDYKTLKVNLDSRKVTIGEENINMTPKEFDLLSFFIKNSDRVFTREQLLNKVWGYEFAGDYRTVDTHVKMLRESLRQYRNLLVTVWGVGYKFEIGG